MSDTNLATRQRINIEKRIARAVARAMIAAGYSVTVDDGDSDECPLRRSRDESAILAAMMSTDGDYLHIHKADQPVMTGNADTQNAFGWVRFIYGNEGWDVVNDYTTNLESIMAPVNDLCNAIDDGTAPDEAEPMRVALRQIIAARDYCAETGGKYPDGTLADDQSFDDWAADLATAALDS